ncbi:MAG: DNA polymerase III subunit alpha, partial [Candidatus Dormibacteraeota bacterium]|nr:DNA polymerase III subunit alpha [Candidatus Dormibacteraeota bacterium]
LDDKKAYDLIAAADTHGVFQLDGAGMRRMLTEMRPGDFGDVTAAVALYRPGPMVNIPAFIARKQGREQIEYLHPKLEPILKDTYGVMIYQEQVMETARQLCGFTLSEADILRAAMGKKDKAKMAKLREKFLAGAAANGIDSHTADSLFEGIAKFAEYAFNKAHSAAYAVISYQTAYLKANYPLEYLTALLVHEQGSADKVATTIVDCRAHGIDVLPPDVNVSGVDFSVSGEAIRFGLGAIKNIGIAACDAVVAERASGGAFESRDDLLERLAAIPEVNFRGVQSLVESGACDSLDDRNRLLFNLDKAWESAAAAARDRAAGQTTLFGEMKIEQSVPQTLQPMPPETKLQLEKDLLGLYLSDHPLKRIAGELAKVTDAQAVEITSEIQGQEVRVGGLVREARRVVTKKGQIMAYAEIEDLTGIIDVILFPRQYEQYHRLFVADAMVVVFGKVDVRAGNRSNGPGNPDAEELEAEVERASVVIEQAWLWDDPDCAPVARRQVLHLTLPQGNGVQLTRLEEALATHPGPDEVVLHIRLKGHEVVLAADARYHVAADSALTAELDRLYGAKVSWVETIRNKAANGNGSGRQGRKYGN